MRRIALIGCSKKKQGKDCATALYKAADIYLGNNYKIAKEQGIKYFQCEEKFYILSGKYGLLASDERISYYDTYLGKFPVKEKIKWAKMVLEQLKHNFDLSSTEFVIFAGDSYSKYIKAYLNCIILKFERRTITFEIKEQLSNGKNYGN